MYIIYINIHQITECLSILFNIYAVTSVIKKKKKRGKRKPSDTKSTSVDVHHATLIIRPAFFIFPESGPTFRRWWPQSGVRGERRSRLVEQVRVHRGPATGVSGESFGDQVSARTGNGKQQQQRKRNPGERGMGEEEKEGER